MTGKEVVNALMKRAIIEDSVMEAMLILTDYLLLPPYEQGIGLLHALLSAAEVARRLDPSGPKLLMEVMDNAAYV